MAMKSPMMSSVAFLEATEVDGPLELVSGRTLEI